MLNTHNILVLLFFFTAGRYCPLLVDDGIMEIVQWLITSSGEKVTELDS